MYGPLLPDEHRTIPGSGDNTIRIWENLGSMPRSIQEASLPGCELLLAPPMGNSPPSFLMTEPFESGIDTETGAAAGKPLREHKI